MSEGILEEAGVSRHEYRPRPERVAANMRRVTAVVEHRLNVLRSALDGARDAFLEVRSRVEALEQWRVNVTVPALQALGQKNQQQDAKLAALEARVTALEGP